MGWSDNTTFNADFYLLYGRKDEQSNFIALLQLTMNATCLHSLTVLFFYTTSLVLTGPSTISVQGEALLWATACPRADRSCQLEEDKHLWIRIHRDSQVNCWGWAWWSKTLFLTWSFGIRLPDDLERAGTAPFFKSHILVKDNSLMYQFLKIFQFSSFSFHKLPSRKTKKGVSCREGSQKYPQGIWGTRVQVCLLFGVFIWTQFCLNISPVLFCIAVCHEIAASIHWFPAEQLHSVYDQFQH